MSQPDIYMFSLPDSLAYSSSIWCPGAELPAPVFFNLVELNLVYNADYVSVFYFEYNLGLVYNASHLYLEICLIFFNLIKLNFVYNVDYVSVFYDFDYSLCLVYNASHLYLEIDLVFFNLIELKFNQGIFHPPDQTSCSSSLERCMPSWFQDPQMP